MNKPSIDEILAPKPEVHPRIYAYAIHDAAHKGLLKVGQTTRDVKQRVAEQLKTAAIKNYRIELNEIATRDDGSLFSDHEVRAALVKKGFENVELEWMRCAVEDVKTVLTELRTGQRFTGTHHETFPMRREQAEAVEKTFDYYQSIWAENSNAAPRFLWNAKMRFGKTFTAYQLAKKLGTKRVLVLTFKPAVEDAWQTDLESHADFDGWQYLSRSSGSDPTQIDRNQPVVYFGSFQDLLGRDAAGNIKPKNEWIHTVNWDLVVFDEYHFGAWRDTAKELFEGEDETVVKQAAKLESELERVNEDLNMLATKESEFLPITTQAYLYLSGTPFKALATREFIEEQIFNWTYTDEQRAKEAFAVENPGKRNPYGALPQMRLLTYQMPDELLAIASGGEFDEFDLNAFFEASGTGDDAQFKHKSDVQKWLDIIRGSYAAKSVEHLKTGTRPPFPYSDVRLLPYLQHSFWFLPNVSACHAMANLLAEKHNVFWHEEGWRALGDNIIETIINKSEKVKDIKNKAKNEDLSDTEKKELSDEEKEYKSKRKLVQEKLIKFATRIPAFMYLTDFRENTLQDVITKLEPELFLTVTGLTVKDFHLLVRLKVFNTEQMNQAVFAFRRYEDASLRYTGIESHQGLSHYGLYDTVVARD